MQNDFYYATESDDATYAEAGEIANAFVSSILTDLRSAIPSDVQIEAVSCRSVVAENGSASGTATYLLPQTNTFGTRTPGAGLGQTSAQDCPLVTYLPETLPGERARTCKVFFPGVNEGDAEDDVLNAAVQTLLYDICGALSAGLTITAGAAAWVARITLANPDPLLKRLVYIRAIVTYIAESFIACQKKRRPRHF